MGLFRHFSANSITLNRMPFLREIAMEAFLYDNPEILALDDGDFSTVSILDAEVGILDGRPSLEKSGRIDLLAIYGDSTVAVIEVKNCELTNSHLEQLEDYLNDKDRLQEVLSKYLESSKISIAGILVGTGISAELKKQLEDGYSIDGSTPIGAITLNRFRGDDSSIYVITDVIFKNSGRNYDRTKYRFRGEVYPKNRLVLNVIRAYVEEHPDITMAKLAKAFPKKLQGSLGCFSTVNEAQQIWDDSKYKRHFLKPEEIIQLEDSRIAVTTQWGIGNIGEFLKQAKQLGMRISKE